MINAAIATAYEDIANLAGLMSICYQYPKLEFTEDASGQSEKGDT
jgi:hypothetical protein